MCRSGAVTVFPSLVQHILVLSVSDSYLPLCEARIVQGSSVGLLGFLFSLFPNRGKVNRGEIEPAFLSGLLKRDQRCLFFFFPPQRQVLGLGPPLTCSCSLWEIACYTLRSAERDCCTYVLELYYVVPNVR